LHERGTEISHETVRFCWNRFGPLFATEIRQRRLDRMQSGTYWRWHLDHCLWRALDHEGEVLESFVTKCRDRKAALKFLRKLIKRFGKPEIIVIDKLRPFWRRNEGHRQWNPAGCSLLAKQQCRAF
jgi:putative transposase